MKLNNQFTDNQFSKKEPEPKLLLDLEKKFTIILIFNQLFKEKMLMFNSTEKLTNKYNWTMLLLLLNTKLTVELKLFRFQEIKSLLNQLFRNLLNKEIFIMYNNHQLLEFLFIDLTQYQPLLLKKFQLSEKSQFLLEITKNKELKLLT